MNAGADSSGGRGPRASRDRPGPGHDAPARGPGAGGRLPVRLPGVRPRTSTSPRRGPAVRGLLGRAAAPSRRRSAPAGSRSPREAAGPCGRCRRGLTPFARGASLGPYEGTLRLLVHELKYHARRRVAARLAEALLAQPRRADRPGRRGRAGAGAAAPAPPARARLQPVRAARRAPSRRPTGLRVAADALVRREDTPPQTGLSAARRRANVARRVRRAAPACGGGPDRGAGRRRAHHRRHRPRLRARSRAGGGGRGAAADRGARGLSARSRTSRRNT